LNEINELNSASNFIHIVERKEGFIETFRDTMVQYARYRNKVLQSQNKNREETVVHKLRRKKGFLHSENFPKKIAAVIGMCASSLCMLGFLVVAIYSAGILEWRTLWVIVSVLCK
jgi:hypothetical protein